MYFVPAFGINDRGTDITDMAQFEVVLDRVRLALTSASPREIQALLRGLVKGRIISEAYSKSLCLHWLINGLEPLRNPKANQTTDHERTNEGNPEGTKEWLEQVEQAARRLAVPLWQNWDNGWKLLLSLVPSVITGCAPSENITGSDAQWPVWNMEEEGVAIASRTQDLNTGMFNCAEANITDPTFTLHQGGVTDKSKALDFSTYNKASTETDHFSVLRNISHVEDCAADTNITAMLERDVHICTTEGLLSMSVPDIGEVIGNDVGSADDLRMVTQWGMSAMSSCYYLPALIS